jgi:hypothetical protein
MGAPRHASLDVGDFDHDGDIDIVTSNFQTGASSSEHTDWVDVWENKRVGHNTTR